MVAVISRTQGIELDAKAIADALATQLASFKRPKKIVIVDELPRNAMGKVQKADLRRLYQDSFVVPSV